MSKLLIFEKKEFNSQFNKKTTKTSLGTDLSNGTKLHRLDNLLIICHQIGSLTLKHYPRNWHWNTGCHLTPVCPDMMTTALCSNRKIFDTGVLLHNGMQNGGSKGGGEVSCNFVFPSVEEGMQSQSEEVDKEPSPQNPKHHKTKFGAFYYRAVSHVPKSRQ
jgi:hypothetical protein